MTTLAPAPPAARFGDLVAAEWIKMRSLRSTWWTLALTTLFILGSAVTAALADRQNLAGTTPESRNYQGFLCFDAFPPAGYVTLMLVAGSIGAVTVAAEYGSGLIRTTTVAVPARRSVLLAKAVLLSAVWGVLGAVVSPAAFLLSQAILSGSDAGVPITHPGVLRAMAACALVAPVCALTGLGLGALIRHGAAAVLGTCFGLLVLPMLFPVSKQWSADVNQLMVVSAWRRLVQTWGQLPGDSIHIATVTESWAVFALWPLVTLALALLVIRRRDV
ncbi:ABC-type transport system involved in multi-copper enzyme maturation permease subunit [Kitasatospora gansuensis]|uniref:ABC-type transport system involved in multi-copper enzyme maturation permease subunit n=1 Tax=Kitasatospora gansuensis TaxID=258050 RepID=A0A7W7WL04_9ACTN|nr:ABC transporter permease subunit [Kitasatospora gansuensis]MBB4950773.1 ABC-type transport system involved in multi-copper enzyme maturation permease subunit [Kitasatospora gansuensis]